MAETYDMEQCSFSRVFHGTIPTTYFITLVTEGEVEIILPSKPLLDVHVGETALIASVDFPEASIEVVITGYSEVKPAKQSKDGFISWVTSSQPYRCRVLHMKLYREEDDQ